jgi:hypothetical protein
MTLVAEEYSTRNASPLSMQLWRCLSCEGFQWRLNDSFTCVPLVGRFFEHLCELQEETARRAYASTQ